MRGKKSEHSEQCCVIDWCNANLNKYPMLKWIYAIPSGAYLGSDKRQRGITMNILKAEGFKPGVPDLCLPYPRLFMGDDPIHGLYVEQKIKGGTVKPHQQEWIDYLNNAGYLCKVVWSADEAIKIIEDYLKG